MAANPAKGLEGKGRRLSWKPSLWKRASPGRRKGATFTLPGVVSAESSLSPREPRSSADARRARTGALGLDSATTKELRRQLHARWPKVRGKIDAGIRGSSAVRRTSRPESRPKGHPSRAHGHSGRWSVVGVAGPTRRLVGGSDNVLNSLVRVNLQ